MLRNVIFFWLGLLISFLTFLPFAQDAFAVCYTPEQLLGLTGSYPPPVAPPGWGIVCDPCANPAYVECRAVPLDSDDAMWDWEGNELENNCNNGVADAGEEGFDCGGECSSPCLTACPGGTELTEVGEAGGQQICVYITQPNSLNQCPSGYEHSVQGSECHSIEWWEPAKLKEDYLTQQDMIDSLYTITPKPEEFGGGTLSIVKTASPESVVDNGDGTETATRTITTDDGEGNKSTETVSVDRPAGSQPGTGFSDSPGGPGIAPGYEGTSTTDLQTDGSEDMENYNFDSSMPGPNDYNTEIDDMPEKESIIGIIDGMFDSLPIVSALNSTQIQTSETVCSVSAGEVFGKQIAINLCQWEDLLRSLGAVFVIVAQVTAIFIVVRGLK